jgi:hypothetical protein
MGCGCGASQSTQSTPVPQQLKVQQVQSESCSYTIEQVNNWLSIILCVKEKAYYIEPLKIPLKQINRYVSFLTSAKNYSHNMCYFKELEEIEAFITVLTVKELCQTA